MTSQNVNIVQIAGHKSAQNLNKIQYIEEALLKGSAFSHAINETQTNGK